MEFGKFDYTTTAHDLDRELVRELVCDLLWLNSIMISRSQTWSQTWFPTCRRQVRAISNRTWSQTGSGHIQLRYLAR